MILLPRVIRTPHELRHWRKEAQGTVGLVPTMGALHEGHAELLRKLRPSCDQLVLTIFVNPTQFGPNEDLSKYPRTFEQDLQIAAREKVDLVYAPDPESMYPSGFSTYVEETQISQPLCGKFRPGHFRGVTTIVLKLLNLVQPEHAYFGLKDAQQFFVLDKMVKDLNIPTVLTGVPTVREPDGLALSSRNVYLSPEEREIAPRFYKALGQLKSELLETKEVDKIRDSLKKHSDSLESFGFQVQYLNLLKLPSFSEFSVNVDFNQPALLAAAVFLGKTRLIDNVILHPEKLSAFGIRID